MSPINVHLCSRVHAHLRARLVLSVCTCRRMFVGGVRICACTRAWEWSYVCDTIAICIHYKGRDEPQMRMYVRIRTPYTNRRVQRQFTRVHAHLRLVASSVGYTYCTRATYI